MGAGIATAFALAGVPTTIFVRRASGIKETSDRVSSRLDAHLRLGLADVEAIAAAELRIETRRALEAGPYDVVVESISEDVEAKREVLSQAEAVLADNGVLCTNTSSLALGELAVAVQDRGRLAGWHWFHPADLMELVEVVPVTGTRPSTIERLAAWSCALGKAPVVLTRDSQGFVANRLQYALLREAYSLVAEGVCAVADVDIAVTKGLGARWAAVGPFASMDLAGLDVHAAVARTLFPLLSRQVEVPELLEAAIRDGALGAARGAGLRGRYTPEQADELVQVRDRSLAARLRAGAGAGAVEQAPR
jgi:3-hydroxybutyryl-CoA dehydrogenase